MYAWRIFNIKMETLDLEFYICKWKYNWLIYFCTESRDKIYLLEITFIDIT